ncbi:MAG TPA: ribosome biogenesis GTP-binding protein YihA/YsxC [Chitinophagaceae bacterium]|nr:ribosome biogenesis GTP-binding protein YihA/YsxC [Chitinophagaceae bacterium]
MEIISAEYVISSPGYKQCPSPDRPEFAFIGRSNVGKSSLINMITGRKELAKISATPGKTKLINHFAIRSMNPEKNKKTSDWYLADLPGYGYAHVSVKDRNNWSNIIESYIRKRENLVCLFVLIDSRHEPQALDLEFLNQLGGWQTPFVLVFTKADKNKPAATLRNTAVFLSSLSERWEEVPPHFVTSATHKTGREALLSYIQSLTDGFKKLVGFSH